MNKDAARRLKATAEEAGRVFSNPDRSLNPGEVFHVKQIKPLSDHTAAVIYKKTPSNKDAAFFFYHVNTWKNGKPDPQWRYFVPTDSHVVGMQRFKDLMQDIEQHNFPRNFDDNPDQRQIPD